MIVSYEQVEQVSVTTSITNQPRNVCEEPRRAPEHEMKLDKTASYDPNGLLSKPPRDQKGSRGESLRVNVDFSFYSDCYRYPPFTPYDMENIPYQLYNAGVTDQEWSEFSKRLEQVNKTRNTYYNIFCLLSCLLPPLSCIYSQASVKNLAAWDTELRKWQDDFNNEVLIRQGCYVKTKSHCFAKAGGGKNQKMRYFTRWITFALTPAESEALKHEPHLTGDIYKGDLIFPSSNEATFCIHPN